MSVSHETSYFVNQFPGLDPQLISVNDLYDRPKEEVTWVVDKLFRVKSMSMLYGFPGDGKSSLARQYAASVLLQKPFLGLSVPKMRPIIYLNSDHEIPEDIRTYFHLLNVPRDALMWTIFGRPPTKARRFEEIADERLQWLKKQIDIVKVGCGIEPVVISDTMFNFTPVPALNDYSVMYYLSPLCDMARETGAPILNNHHTGKGHKDPREAFQGNTSVIATFEIGLHIDRNKTSTTLMLTKYRTPNSIPPIPYETKIPLAFDVNTKIFSLIDGDFVGGEASDSISRNENAGIIFIHFLKRNPWVQLPDIGKYLRNNTVKISNTDLKSLADKLVAEGKLVTRMGGERGTAIEYNSVEMNSGESTTLPESKSTLPDTILGYSPAPPLGGQSTRRVASTGKHVIKDSTGRKIEDSNGILNSFLSKG